MAMIWIWKKKLLLNVKVKEMEPWDIGAACSFSFVKKCPETLDSIAKHPLSIYEKGKEHFGVKPFEYETIFRNQLVSVIKKIKLRIGSTAT